MGLSRTQHLEFITTWLMTYLRPPWSYGELYGYVEKRYKGEVFPRQHNHVASVVYNVIHDAFRDRLFGPVWGASCHELQVMVPLGRHVVVTHQDLRVLDMPDHPHHAPARLIELANWYWPFALSDDWLLVATHHGLAMVDVAVGTSYRRAQDLIIEYGAFE